MTLAEFTAHTESLHLNSVSGGWVSTEGARTPGRCWWGWSFWTQGESGESQAKGGAPPPTPGLPSQFSDPDLVKNLRVEKRTNSSISLCWDDPKSPNSQNYTYWVQWTNQGDKNETRNTTDTCFTADGLQPSSSYKFFVWAEAGGSNGTPGMLQATTGDRSPWDGCGCLAAWLAFEGRGLQGSQQKGQVL